LVKDAYGDGLHYTATYTKINVLLEKLAIIAVINYQQKYSKREYTSMQNFIKELIGRS
jgi:hypothetical protein